MTSKQSHKDGIVNKGRSESMWLMTTSLVILASVALAFAIAYTRKVMIPFVLALFIVTIVSPLLDFQMSRLRIPRILAVASTLTVVLIVTVLVCGTLWQTGSTIFSTVNTYNKEVNSMLDQTQQWYEKAKTQFEHRFRRKNETQPLDANSPVAEPNVASETPSSKVFSPNTPLTFELSVTPDSQQQDHAGAQVNPLLPRDFKNSLPLTIKPLPEKPPFSPTSPKGKKQPAQNPFEHNNKLFSLVGDLLGGVLRNMVDVLVQLLSNVVFVIIFVIFMLSGRDPRIVRKGVYAEIDQKIRRYIGTKVAISLVTAILVWFVLYKLNMRLAGVFGILTFLLNFIPSLGSIVSTLLPIPIALAQYHNDPLLVALVILIPGAIQIVMGNVVEPKLMGEGLNLHPVTILLALSFWGLLWGFVGMFLAAPMTAVIRIVLMQFDTLKPVGRLLAGELSQGTESAER